MCYNIAYLTKKKNDYQKRLGNKASYLEKSLDVAIQSKGMRAFLANAYTHPHVPVIINSGSNDYSIEFLNWGLIPFWVNDATTANSIANKTLIARGETVFEKASFKASVKYRRCLVLVDGFYEYHYHQGKTIPCYIQMRDRSPFTIGGIWDHWEEHSTGHSHYTFSIITTVGNRLLSTLHNNPKLKEPRMPLIFHQNKQFEWLMKNKALEDIEKIKKLIVPYLADCQEQELVAYPVNKISGKNAWGNVQASTHSINIEGLPF